jgi:hypothetical protein
MLYRAINQLRHSYASSVAFYMNVVILTFLFLKKKISLEEKLTLFVENRTFWEKIGLLEILPEKKSLQF